MARLKRIRDTLAALALTGLASCVSASRYDEAVANRDYLLGRSEAEHDLLEREKTAEVAKREKAEAERDRARTETEIALQGRRTAEIEARLSQSQADSILSSDERNFIAKRAADNSRALDEWKAKGASKAYVGRLEAQWRDDLEALRRDNVARDALIAGNSNRLDDAEDEIDSTNEDVGILYDVARKEYELRQELLERLLEGEAEYDALLLGGLQ